MIQMNLIAQTQINHLLIILLLILIEKVKILLKNQNMSFKSKIHIRKQIKNSFLIFNVKHNLIF